MCVYIVDVCASDTCVCMCLMVHLVHVCMWCMYVYMVHNFTYLFGSACGAYVSHWMCSMCTL